MQRRPRRGLLTLPLVAPDAAVRERTKARKISASVPALARAAQPVLAPIELPLRP